MTLCPFIVLLILILSINLKKSNFSNYIVFYYFYFFSKAENEESMLNLDYTPPRTHPPTHPPPAKDESILSPGGIIDINFTYKLNKTLTLIII